MSLHQQHRRGRLRGDAMSGGLRLPLVDPETATGAAGEIEPVEAVG